MKKQFYLLFAILVAFSSLFVSCDENGPDSDLTICKITVMKDGDGTVSITNYIGMSVNVLIGNQVEVVATPAVGSAFTGWYLSDGETLVSTKAKFIFTASENTTLIARFTRLSNLVVRSAGYGSVSFKDSADDTLAFLPGSEVTVVATPDKDCDFIGWFVGDSETAVCTDAEYTFTVPEEDMTLTAKFSKRLVVTIRSAGYGSVSFKDSADDTLAFLSGSEVTVVATPYKDCDFIGWFVGDSETAVCTDAEYTFTVIEDVNMVAKFEKRKTYIDGYEYVDLGLSVKWATCNVGATSPDEYGGYYAWGETEEKSSYDWSTYKWCYGYSDTQTKYCTSNRYGTVDNKTVLDPEDDVAHVKWGGSWRMPTRAERDELRNNCSWKWTTLNGVKGYEVTGPNGNCIFLPAAGERLGTYLDNSGSDGYYWSNSLNEGGSDGAYGLFFNGSYYDRYNFDFRCYGHSVRPVSE